MSAQGNAILSAARSAFRSQRTVETLAKITVPEWGAELYYWPEMSVEERLAVYAHVKIATERNLADVVRMSLAQVLWRARDAFGNRLFSDDDEAALADTDPDVLQRVAAAMGTGETESIEDAEKK